MKVYRNIADFQLGKGNSVLAIGSFDGLHLGHQKIIEKVLHLAQSNGLTSVILTFHPHPRMILNPEDESLKLLTSIEERVSILGKMGIEHLIITPFNRDFSNMSARSYIEYILVNCIRVKHIVIGHDHRFGKNRTGDIHLLKEVSKDYSFHISEIEAQEIQNNSINSTKIRNALHTGDIKLANSLLGYSFFIHGKVIKGDKIGRTIGFPTANLYLEDLLKIVPTDGVYAVSIALGEEIYKGMAYIGNRPTINGMTKNIEVHIFNFDKEIYGQMLRMNFEHFIRKGEKFNSLDALKKQLHQDKDSVITYFS